MGTRAASIEFVVGEPMHDTADVLLSLNCPTAAIDVRLILEGFAQGHWSASLPLPPLTLDVLHACDSGRFANSAMQLAGSTTVVLPPGSEALCSIASFARVFSGQSYLLRVFDSAHVQPAEVTVTGADEPQSVVMRLRRLWRRVRVILRSAQELPLPYGLRVQARHRSGVVVASGIAGEPEAAEYEGELAAESSSMTLRAEEATRRISEAAARHLFAFHGVDEPQLPSAAATWSVHHGDVAARAENWRCLSAVAAAFSDYPDLHLEVAVATYLPPRAPVLLAAHFGSHEVEAGPVMLRLARERAQAILEALVQVGVPERRLLATFCSASAADSVSFCARTTAWRRTAVATQAHEAAARLAASAQSQLSALLAPADKLAFEGVVTPQAGTARFGHGDVLLHSDRGIGGTALSDDSLRRIFDSIPRSHDGSMAATELEPALVQLGVDSSSPKARNLLSRYHTYERVRLTLQEFSSLMRDFSSLSPEEPPLAIASTEMRRAIEQLGLHATAEQAAAVLSRYDADASGRLDFDEFCRLVADVAAFQSAGMQPSPGPPNDATVRRIFYRFARSSGAAHTTVPLEPQSASTTLRDGTVLSWSLDPGDAKRQTNTRVLDAVAAVLAAQPAIDLVVQPETSRADAAARALEASKETTDQAELIQRLSALRGEAIVAALSSRGVDPGRVSLSALPNDAPTVFSFSCTKEKAGRAADALTLLEATRIGALRREQHVPTGRTTAGAATYAAVSKPASTSILLDVPGAFLVGEEYLIETLPEPSMGVAAAQVEIKIGHSDVELEIPLERPAGDVRIDLVWSKADTAHWAAKLPLPWKVPIRISHPALGLIMPEANLGTSLDLVPPTDAAIRIVFERYTRGAPTSKAPDAAAIRDAFDKYARSLAPPAAPAREVLSTAFATFAKPLTAPAAPTRDAVRRAFQSADADRSGSLSRRELRRALGPLGIALSGAEAAAVLSRYDTDSDGTLSLGEFVNVVRELVILQSPRFPSLPPRPSPSAVRRAFEAFDRDRSGKLSIHGELPAALSHLLMDETSADAAEAMRRYDTDGNGSVSRTEFAALARDLDGHRRKGARASEAAISTAELQATLLQLGLDATEDQTKAVLERYDADASGTLELGEFAKLVADVFAFQSAGGASATSPSEEVVKRTFSFFARRAYVPEPLNGLAIDEAFTRFDRDMSGSLSRGELRLALGQLFVQQSPLMSRRADEAMREFEAGGTRALTLSQFSQLVHALVEQQQQDALMALSTSDLLGALRQLGLEATGEQAAAVLKKYDEDRSGTISLSEFERLAQDLSDYLATQSRPAISSRDLHSALQGMGVRATDAQAAAVMARYDADKSGTLEHPEFEKLVLDLHQHLHGGAAARPATLAPPAAAPGDGAIRRIFLLFAKPPPVAPRVPKPRRSAVRAAFAAFDSDKSGKLSRSEFQAALCHWMFDSVPSSRELLVRFDADRSGSLSLSEFRRLVQELSEFQARDCPRSPQVSRDCPRFTEVECQAKGADSTAGLIGSAELRPALESLGLNATAEQTAAVLARYDDDKSGTLELPEFEKLVHDLADYFAKADGAAARPRPTGEEIRRIFAQWCTGTALLPVSIDVDTVEQTFRHFDRDCSGTLSRAELRGALGHLFFVSSSAHAEELLREHDRNSDTKLSLGEFGRVVESLLAAQAAERALSVPSRSLREALSQLGLDATREQADAVIRRYDADESGRLELSEFRRLIADVSAYLAQASSASSDTMSSVSDVHMALHGLGLRITEGEVSEALRRRGGTLTLAEFARFVKEVAGASSAIAPVPSPVLADSSKLGHAVLRYALRSRLFVGETYTLEILETDELRSARIEFKLASTETQVVQAVLHRKWRDLRVNLRYRLGEGEVEGYYSLPSGLTLHARHEGLKAVTSSSTEVAVSGLFATTVLSGDEALYVGQPYAFSLDGLDGLDVISSMSTVVSPLSPAGEAPVELVVGPPSGTLSEPSRNLPVGASRARAWAGDRRSGGGAIGRFCRQRSLGRALAAAVERPLPRPRRRRVWACLPRVAHRQRGALPARQGSEALRGARVRARGAALELARGVICRLQGGEGGANGGVGDSPRRGPRLRRLQDAPRRDASLVGATATPGALLIPRRAQEHSDRRHRGRGDRHHTRRRGGAHAARPQRHPRRAAASGAALCRRDVPSRGRRRRSPGRLDASRRGALSRARLPGEERRLLQRRRAARAPDHRAGVVGVPPRPGKARDQPAHPPRDRRDPARLPRRLVPCPRHHGRGVERAGRSRPPLWPRPDRACRAPDGAPRPEPR